MSLFKQIGYVFTGKQRWKMAGIFLLQMIETLMDFFSISLILPFVAILTQVDRIDQAGWYKSICSLIGPQSPQTVLFIVTLSMLGLYVVKNAYTLWLTNIRIRFLSVNQIRMGTRMMSCYMHKPYTFHLQRNSAQIVRNVNSDVSGAFNVVASIFALVSDILIIVVLVVFLFAVDPGMTLAILLGLAFCSAMYFLVVRGKIRKAGEHNREYGAKMIKAVQQAMGGIKEVKIMGREAYFSRVYNEVGSEYVERRRKFNVIAAVPGRLIETVCMGTILGVIAYKIYSGQDLAQVVPSLSAFAVAAVRLLPRANGINSHINAITYNLPSLNALYEDLTESDRQAEERQKETEEKRKQPKKDTGNGDIILENVSFTYPETDSPVLKNVDLHIKKGQSVGVVGVTGAGKTTLVDLILGLLKPDTGRICYGTMDIHEDYEQWLKHIGYIPQTIYLTDDSIAKNVALGVPEEEIDEQALWKALDNAQLGDFVRGLKEGENTVIGERGVRLSGGQRQRIGIARALYRDPEILFFDEATSSLDNETESAVMDAINTLGSQKTMIIVAHRLTTIENCDRIFRVAENSVEESSLVRK
ncbi:MAG: ABC transporter ATP-binding protein [Oscillospiraceae bacterium]|nr:ABC transporter ATP-binding protein [Oscillospiraceae bacterium]